MIEGFNVVIGGFAIHDFGVGAQHDGKVFNRIIESMTASGNGLHGDGRRQGSVAGCMPLLCVEFSGPVLLHLWTVSSTATKGVWVLCTTAGAGASQNSRHTTALAPPFDGVLHTGHWAALSDVRAGTVGLSAVGSAGSHGQLDEVLANFRLKSRWKSHFGAVGNFNVKTS